MFGMQAAHRTRSERMRLALFSATMNWGTFALAHRMLIKVCINWLLLWLLLHVKNMPENRSNTLFRKWRSNYKRIFASDRDAGRVAYRQYTTIGYLITQSRLVDILVNTHLQPNERCRRAWFELLFVYHCGACTFRAEGFDGKSHTEWHIVCKRTPLVIPFEFEFYFKLIQHIMCNETSPNCMLQPKTYGKMCEKTPPRKHHWRRRHPCLHKWKVKFWWTKSRPSEHWTMVVRMCIGGYYHAAG